MATTLALWLSNRIKSLGAGPCGGWLYTVTREPGLHLSPAPGLIQARRKKEFCQSQKVTFPS